MTQLLYTILVMSLPLSLFCHASEKFPRHSDLGVPRNSEVLYEQSEGAKADADAAATWSRRLAGERLMNAVLAQIQTKGLERMQLEPAYYGGPLVEPYGEPSIPDFIESSPENWDRSQRQIDPSRKRYSSICELDRRYVRLENDDYEYRPSHYEEVFCVNRHLDDPQKNICRSFNFRCVEYRKQLHLMKRKYTSACWEIELRNITVSCECYWPEHELGPIKYHRDD